MRIVIDMQGAQSASRHRGIGRYTLAFAKAVTRHRGEHEVILALSGSFPETIESIRASFEGLLPQKNILVWYAPGPVAECDMANNVRREVAELIREDFLARLNPDVIHLTSLFEGFLDDAVTSICKFDNQIPVSVSLYDLIPLLNPNEYLEPNQAYKEHYQRKISYLRQAKIFLAISEYSRYEGIANLNLQANMVVNISAAADDTFGKFVFDDVAIELMYKKFHLTRPFILYTGATDERKNLKRLIEAFAKLPESLRKLHQLVFAGGLPTENLIELKKIAKSSGIKADELIITNHVTDKELEFLYKYCQLYVFPSWHEGFGLPVHEAMICGAPVICSNVTSLPELIDLREAMFDPFNVSDIAQKMQQVLTNDSFRQQLRTHSLNRAKLFSWDETARRAISTWEKIPIENSQSSTYDCLEESKLFSSLAEYINLRGETLIVSTSACLALNQHVNLERQLFVDISELVQHDAKTGIQRVVRNLLREWLANPPPGFRVAPVYATKESGYRYAKRYIQDLMSLPKDNIKDELIDFGVGDVFFGLDFQPHVQINQEHFYQKLRRHGVSVFFLVYDLLPIQMPQSFPFEVENIFKQWLKVVSGVDGAVCISEVVSKDLNNWVENNDSNRLRPFKTNWFHLGADIDKNNQELDYSQAFEATLRQLIKSPSFMMVGTLEPRKGHAQVLDAFELLWQSDVDINLVIVGKKGWLTEPFIYRLINHQELNKRLFWLQGVGDKQLETLYTACSCLIAASYGEGFGLPLIEAAQHKLPIICRDIPVFREVASENVFYFDATKPEELADSIQQWLNLYKKDKHPRSDNMHWLTWKQSASQLLSAIGIHSS